MEEVGRHVFSFQRLEDGAIEIDSCDVHRLLVLKNSSKRREKWGKTVKNHLSNEKNLGWLGYIGDHTTQLYRALS